MNNNRLLSILALCAILSAASAFNKDLFTGTPTAIVDLSVAADKAAFYWNTAVLNGDTDGTYNLVGLDDNRKYTATQKVKVTVRPLDKDLKAGTDATPDLAVNCNKERGETFVLGGKTVAHVCQAETTQDSKKVLNLFVYTFQAASTKVTTTQVSAVTATGITPALVEAYVKNDVLYIVFTQTSDLNVQAYTLGDNNALTAAQTAPVKVNSVGIVANTANPACDSDSKKVVTCIWKVTNKVVSQTINLVTPGVISADTDLIADDATANTAYTPDDLLVTDAKKIAFIKEAQTSAVSGSNPATVKPGYVLIDLADTKWIYVLPEALATASNDIFYVESYKDNFFALVDSDNADLEKGDVKIIKFDKNFTVIGDAVNFLTDGGWIYQSSPVGTTNGGILFLEKDAADSNKEKLYWAKQFTPVTGSEVSSSSSSGAAAGGDTKDPTKFGSSLSCAVAAVAIFVSMLLAF